MGVLVGTALPGAVWIGKRDRHPCACCQPLGCRHFPALVIRQREARWRIHAVESRAEAGQRRRRRRIFHCSQYRQERGPFHQRPDSGAIRRALAEGTLSSVPGSTARQSQADGHECGPGQESAHAGLRHAYGGGAWQGRRATSQSRPCAVRHAAWPRWRCSGSRNLHGRGVWRPPPLVCPQPALVSSLRSGIACLNPTAWVPVAGDSPHAACSCSPAHGWGPPRRDSPLPQPVVQDRAAVSGRSSHGVEARVRRGRLTGLWPWPLQQGCPPSPGVVVSLPARQYSIEHSFFPCTIIP